MFLDNFVGWSIVLEILTSVPVSLRDEDMIDTVQVESEVNAYSFEQQWPREALPDAFACVKLVVDEYLELIVNDLSLVDSLLRSLVKFAAQNIDINTSLTSVELLWKVADGAISSKSKNKQAGTAAYVFAQMFDYLSKLAMDSRPEIRNCAINTIFSAATANSQQLGNTLWCSLFDNIIYIIFENAGSRSMLAKRLVYIILAVYFTY